MLVITNPKRFAFTIIAFEPHSLHLKIEIKPKYVHREFSERLHINIPFTIVYYTRYNTTQYIIHNVLVSVAKATK